MQRREVEGGEGEDEDTGGAGIRKERIELAFWIQEEKRVRAVEHAAHDALKGSPWEDKNDRVRCAS